MKSPASAFALLTTSLALLAAAPDDLKTIRGVVRIDGSSTVFPITEAVAEEFAKVAPKINVTVGVSGTGGGFKRFTAGEIDISAASRPIRAAEAAVAAAGGLEFIELAVAFDALSFVVHPKNDWVKTLSLDQIRKIYLAGDAAKKWSDIDPSWPARPIHCFSPGTDSGTFDYFKEVVAGSMGQIRADMSVSEDDNALVTGVAGDPDAIGYFGLAYFEENTDKLRAIPVINVAGVAVAPSAASVNNGTYTPFSRPLFIYVNRKSAEQPGVKGFVEFFLAEAPALVDEVGYVAIPADLYSRTNSHWTARTTGSAWIHDGKDVPGDFAATYK